MTVWFTVKLDDRPGSLARVATALGERGVNITGIVGVAEDTDGALMLTTSDAAATREAFAGLGLAVRGARPDRRHGARRDVRQRPPTRRGRSRLAGLMPRRPRGRDRGDPVRRRRSTRRRCRRSSTRVAAIGGRIRTLATVRRDRGRPAADARSSSRSRASPRRRWSRALEALADVRAVHLTRALDRVFGKRIIVVGGGAQVAQVALGAVSEADRHNLRGERISVDTIPLVGEEHIAAAVRAVADLPRARLLVLAGSIMGGDISVAAEELRAVGIPIIALNMVGSITEHVDLVVSDPVQAGTMAVMAVADTATFDLERQRGRRY